MPVVIGPAPEKGAGDEQTSLVPTAYRSDPGPSGQDYSIAQTEGPAGSPVGLSLGSPDLLDLRSLQIPGSARVATGGSRRLSDHKVPSGRLLRRFRHMDLGMLNRRRHRGWTAVPCEDHGEF